MPALLQAPGQAAWPHLQRLLLALLRFMEPYLRNADLIEAVRVLYKVRARGARGPSATSGRAAHRGPRRAPRAAWRRCSVEGAAAPALLPAAASACMPRRLLRVWSPSLSAAWRASRDHGAAGAALKRDRGGFSA